MNCNIENFSSPPVMYDSMDDFYSSYGGESGSWKIKLDGADFDFEIKIKDPRLIVFFFTGARPRESTLPFFSGKSLSNVTEASSVFFSDPMQYKGDNMRLCWYAGDKSNRLQNIYKKLIAFLINKIGSNRSIFFGGSGGGFASLYYSREVENSLAIVWNPQVNISKYSAGRYSVIDKYSNSCFDCNRDELSNFIDVDLAPLYEKGHSNYVIYMQNITDKHVQRDMLPFATSYCKNHAHKLNKTGQVLINDRFLFHLTDWSSGHRPPPRLALRYILKRLSNPELDWFPRGFRVTVSKAEDLTKK
ncbi:hypothetical protein [Vreelandella alkaliphila]|uniref:hypothetical protein n=1 Tax=Vreelandella alkaliphila TaxID=272774 RepID=UPI003FD8DEAC